MGIVLSSFTAGHIEKGHTHTDTPRGHLQFLIKLAIASLYVGKLTNNMEYDNVYKYVAYQKSPMGLTEKKNSAGVPSIGTFWIF